MYKQKRLLLQLALLSKKILFALFISFTLFTSYCMVVYIRQISIKSNYTEINDEQLVEIRKYLWTQYNILPSEDITKKEIKLKVEKVIKPILFAYLEVDTIVQNGKPTTASGLTDFINRVIYIRKDLNNLDYAQTLCHEYVHLNQLLNDERMTDYKSIILLYESGDAFLQKSALYRILGMFQSNNNKQFIKYNANKWLYDYFKSKI